MRKWIFLRGLARESIHWGDFTKIFQDQFPDDEILTIDSRGNGTERHLPSFLSIEDSVRDLRKRSEGFRGDKGCYLLTISLGSMLGINWAEKYPEDVKGLVCINTSIAGLSPFYQRLRPQNYLNVLRIASGRLGRYEEENEILKLTTNSYVNAPDQFKKFLSDFALRPATPATNAALQLASASRFRLPKTKPDLPMLVLVSEKDRFVSSSCSKKLAEKWSLPLEIHPWGGHDLPLEDPEWIAKQVESWLD